MSSLRALASTLLFAVVVLAGPNPSWADDCTRLRSAYTEALAAARACSLASPDACQAERAADLADACQCAVSVNPQRTRELDRLRARYEARGCRPEPAVCSRACVQAIHVCQARPGASPRCESP